LYCRSCGKETAEKAVMCVSCGVNPKNGTNFCQNCSGETGPETEVCTKCGVKLTKGGSGEKVCTKCGVKLTKGGSGEKEWMITLLLCIFLGGLGIHRFYTGHTAIGIIQLLTLGGCGIWVLIDLILIIIGSFKDADGNELAR